MRWAGHLENTSNTTQRLARRWVVLAVFMSWLAGCSIPLASAPAAVPTLSTSTLPGASPTPVQESSVTPTPTRQAPTTAASPTATRRPSSTATTATEVNGPCSPLEGIALGELSSPDLLKNPFELPRPGWDEGHHGVDFAYWSRPGHSTMVGLPVRSVLSGRAAAVLPNRPPYGNAVIIETILSDLPPGWRKALLPVLLNTPAPTVTPPSLHCPSPAADYGHPGERTLYLLYAHMNEPSPLLPGQSVSCGQAIGAIGTTGSSVNAHLHLETRLGPPGATFTSMAHYLNDATDEEMAAYCTWRVSGLFELVDPMTLLSLQP